MGLFLTIIVGAIAGWLAALLIKGRGFGLIGNIVVGIVGAFVARLVLPSLGFAEPEGFLLSILYATAGAAILLGVIQVVKRV